MNEILGVHPFAEKFPMLSDGELSELAESIGANGLRSPVVLTVDGLILDGRNRHAACQRLGIVTETIVYENEDFAEFVIDSNVARRNMSTGARAMATALVLEADGRRNDGRWKRGSIKQDFALSDVLRVALVKAGTVLDFAPDLTQQVVDGDLALDAAFKEAERNRDAERNRLDADERRKLEEAEAETFIVANAPDLAALVGDSLKTFTEAQAIWGQRNREEAERIRAEKAAEDRKLREHKEAMTDFYSGIARGLQIVGGYGRYTDIQEIMRDYSPNFLSPPQFESEYTLENLHSAQRFINELITWQGSRA
jgi:hypothetical protein